MILSQRLGEWCGHGPVLEEDLALTNIALDLLGQARLWYGLVPGDEDELAFLRDAGAYRNLLLVEQANGDYAHTMARQLYFDAWHLLLLEQLRGSAETAIAEIAAKAAPEIAYHLRRSRDWVVRLGDGTEESHGRMQRAIDDLWAYTGEMFTPDGVDASFCDLAALKAPWREQMEKTLGEATLEVPKDNWAQRGGKQGVHSEGLGHLLAEMQFLQRAYPGEKW